jgi:hypothetical protein
MPVRMTPEQKQFADRFAFQDPKDPRCLQLRQEYRLDALVTAGDEVEKLLRLSEWTYGRFFQFGRPTLPTENALEILHGTEAGHFFHCAHYSTVFCAAAAALGWASRLISVRRAEETYRLSNHNIVEVWLKERKQWALFEPTYGGAVAINGEPVNAYEAARQWFTKDGEGLQVVIGPRRQIVAKKDYPYLLKFYKSYKWTQINEKSFGCYGCLAWVPSNQLLGQHGDKSIENWDHWPGIYVYFGAERGWKEDPLTLPPYYPVE